jgi:hypothetical protein
MSKMKKDNQSLVGLMMIDTELGRKDYGLIICNCDQNETKTDPRIKIH